MAVVKVRGLSDEDVKVLKEVVSRVRRGRLNPPLRGPDDLENRIAPEVYIVTPAEAIPAWTDTVGQHGKPGSGVANICLMDETDDGLDEAGFDELVYNLTDSEISANTRNLAVRDKFGRFIVASGGGSSGVWAVVISKETIGGGGRYKCHEITWLPGGHWHEKPGGRIFVNCWEASTRSNANIQRTKTNIVQLWRAPTPPESSASSFGGFPSSSFASSSGSSLIDENMYVFDKALGNVSNPKVV